MLDEGDGDVDNSVDGVAGRRKLVERVLQVDEAIGEQRVEEVLLGRAVVGERLLAEPDRPRNFAKRSTPPHPHVPSPPTRRQRAGADPTGTKLTESFAVERPLAGFMTWLTMKWTGSEDRDDDLHKGMLTTLNRIKLAAESTGV